jgi:hypothetical protein
MLLLKMLSGVSVAASDSVSIPLQGIHVRPAVAAVSGLRVWLVVACNTLHHLKCVLEQ